MGNRRDGMQGSVAVELALTLPFLCLLVIGGWVLSYFAYAKMALAMAVNRAARDLAASVEEYGSLPHVTKAYRFDGGFAESFGLPRWGVHGLVTKSRITEGRGQAPTEFAVVAAVCYRVPFTVPFGVAKKEPPPQYLPDTGEYEQVITDVADLLALEEWKQAVAEYGRLKRQVEEEAAAWDGLVEDAGSAVERGKDIWARVERLLQNTRDLVSDGPADLEPYPAGKRMSAASMERTVRQLCEPPERLKGKSVVLTSRAAYMMQQVYEPPGGQGKGDKSSPGKGKGKSGSSGSGKAP